MALQLPKLSKKIRFKGTGASYTQKKVSRDNKSQNFLH